MKIRTHDKYPVRTRARYTTVSFDTSSDRTTFRDTDDGMILRIGVQALLPLTRRRATTLVRRIVREAQVHELRHLALTADDLVQLEGWESADDSFRLVAENAYLAAYEFHAYKSQAKDGYLGVEDLILIGKFRAHELSALAIGEIVACEVNAARDLANMPGGDMTPAMLAARIRASAQGTKATVRAFGVAQMRKLKMGAVLGVARGARETPRFIIVEYWGAGKRTAPAVFAGKGVTFDTGGLSLKPSDFMLDMHLDMSGGAAAAHAVIAAAKLKLKVNAIALIPAVENAVSGESYRPGDVLRSMSGKTIDILNTDAEGRVILADALTYAQRYKPALVIDIATLTGAALVALGTKASAVLTRDDELAARIQALGEMSGDYVWPLPLWEEYKDMVKGRFGDIANIPVKNPRYGGTIGGGMFLAEFADGYPWAHLDIAPRMVSDEGDHLAQGATGVPVRLLVRLLEEQVVR